MRRLRTAIYTPLYFTLLYIPVVPRLTGISRVDGRRGVSACLVIVRSSSVAVRTRCFAPQIAAVRCTQAVVQHYWYSWRAGRPVHGRTPAASGRRCTVDGRETTTEELVVFQINFYSNNVFLEL